MLDLLKENEKIYDAAIKKYEEKFLNLCLIVILKELERNIRPV